MLFSISSTLLLAAAGIASAKWIVPGARWLDTSGNIFNAHAGGLCVDQESGRFYWFGEYKIEGQEEGGGVSVYSSDDLATWKSHGLALGPLDISWWLPFPSKCFSNKLPSRTCRGPRVHLSGQCHSASQGAL